MRIIYQKQKQKQTKNKTQMIVTKTKTKPRTNVTGGDVVVAIYTIYEINFHWYYCKQLKTNSLYLSPSDYPLSPIHHPINKNKKTKQKTS